MLLPFLCNGLDGVKNKYSTVRVSLATLDVGIDPESPQGITIRKSSGIIEEGRIKGTDHSRSKATSFGYLGEEVISDQLNYR